MLLLSPTLRSHILIQQLLSHLNLHLQVLSFSTYLPHTPLLHTPQPHQLLTSPLNSNFYLRSTPTHSTFIHPISLLFHHFNFLIAVMDTPLHDVLHNTSLYVLPA
ncbi:opine metallophore biosynthesis dehydrogenase, partial [Staphylococcus capitis]|uniref:opine metallophore biosynthesis dehydrogenase n=1 Tax=Staphylococcus capitis TaxID=29388 RepID=UPI0021B1F6A5